jgi:hypothetical protein
VQGAGSAARDAASGLPSAGDRVLATRRAGRRAGLGDRRPALYSPAAPGRGRTEAGAALLAGIPFCQEEWGRRDLGTWGPEGAGRDRVLGWRRHRSGAPRGLGWAEPEWAVGVAED